jgi:Glucosamine 6-phosphate synthetase, contains amidotransferase and phosphosugar isomerase domains
MEKAIIKSIKKLEGSYAFAVVNEENPDQLIAAKKEVH